jgi:hypothetical protein
LPRLRPGNAAALGQALARGAAFEAATPFGALTWLQRSARVRAAAARLDEVFFYAETLATGDAPNLRILQLPVVAGEGWVAQPLSAGRTLPGGRVSIVAHTPLAFDAAAPIAGLAIDEWLEVVPSGAENAAVAFQHDRPNATAPQAILLAVAPSALQWDLDALEAVVLETLELAQLRLVDPHSVRAVGHALPALYFAHNLAGDTINLSTQPTP